MVRAFVLYEARPTRSATSSTPSSAARCPAATFRHGPVFGSPAGEPQYAYYAEWEFPSRDAFKEAARTPEFAATGKDAMEMGGRFHVLFADVD